MKKKPSKIRYGILTSSLLAIICAVLVFLWNRQNIQKDQETTVASDNPTESMSETEPNPNVQNKNDNEGEREEMIQESENQIENSRNQEENVQQPESQNEDSLNQKEKGQQPVDQMETHLNQEGKVQQPQNQNENNDKPEDEKEVLSNNIKSPETYKAFDTISEDILDKQGISLFFTSTDIDTELFDRIYGKSYKEDCLVPKKDLQYLRVLHYGFDGQIHIGELIVNTKIAKDVLEIFEELFEAKYPIEKITLVDDYQADDIKSMADNNSSAFNYRVIDGTTKMSKHSLGLAIDINPLYNPYVRTKNNKLEILPEEGADYINRDEENSYYIKKDDICYNAFVKRGFSWGGNWSSSKDYQHFDINID